MKRNTLSKKEKDIVKSREGREPKAKFLCKSGGFLIYELLEKEKENKQPKDYEDNR